MGSNVQFVFIYIFFPVQIVDQIPDLVNKRNNITNCLDKKSHLLFKKSQETPLNVCYNLDNVDSVTRSVSALYDKEKETGMVSKELAGKRSFYVRHKDAVTAAIILTPMLAWWIVACGFPTVFGFVLGFFEWKSVNATPKFIGLENFITFFSSPHYLSVLWRTVWLGVTCTVLTVLSGFGVALLMNMKLKGRGIYRSLWYIPSVVSTVAVAQIIGILLNPMYGFVNKFLVAQGMEPIILATSVEWNLILIIVYSIWKGVGNSALIWLAGLQCIDPVLYEAAEVDGATGMKKFIHITLPGLRPIVTFIVITSIIGALQIYEPVAFISNGGPQQGTMVLVLQAISEGYFNYDFGMSGTCSMVLAVIVFITAAPYYTGVRRRREKG